MLVVMLGLGPAVLGACGGSVFVCEQASDCRGAGENAVCEPTGWCSFPDPSCASGARYGGLAGDGLADRCVEVGATSDGSSDPTTSPGSASTSSASATEVTTLDTSASTTNDTGTPTCGNGVLDDAEQCDDKNLTAGDGCSPECEVSGTVIWARTMDGDTSGSGHSLAPFTNGDLAVGFVVVLDGAAVPGVWRIDPDGAVVWTWAFPDAGWTSAYTWGLDVAGNGANQRIGVAVDGDTGGSNAGVAMLDAQGSLLWSLIEPQVVLFAAALQPAGPMYVAGYDVSQGGVVIEYSLDGDETGRTFGEPYTPEGGFAFDLVVDGDVVYTAGRYGAPEPQLAFLGAVVNSIGLRSDFGVSDYNEGLALALDPNSGQRWISGYAEAVGGWVGIAGAAGIALEATVVTDAFSANVHGIAIDPSGAAIAVGWDSALGTRDAFVVKVAPDGTRIWASAFETASGDDDLRDVVIAEDGSVFVVGTRLDDAGVAAGWVARLVP